jgi:hypothetical protein
MEAKINVVLKKIQNSGYGVGEACNTGKGPYH